MANDAFLKFIGSIAPVLDEEEPVVSHKATLNNARKARAAVVRMRTGQEPEVKYADVEEVDEALTEEMPTIDRVVAACFLCTGVRYIPVTERAEIGPLMFDVKSSPEDWACCPECNAGGADPMREE